MNIKNLTTGLLALTIGICRAGLYDNSDQLETKYGRPAEVTERDFDSKQIYKSGPYVIEAWIANEHSRHGLYNGQVVWQITKRADGQAMSSSEIEAFLKRTDPREKWAYSGNSTWKMGNYATARYNPFRKNLLENLNH